MPEPSEYPGAVVKPVQVSIHTSDWLLRAGITALLKSSPDVSLVADTERTAPEVLVFAEHVVASAQVETIRRLCSGGTTKRGARCVVVADRFDVDTVLTAVQAGVTSVLPTPCANETRLTDAIVGAGGSVALMPRRLQTVFLRQLRTLQSEVLEPNGLTFSGLELRELDAIRLVAEGFATGEIASKLSCSEGSVRAMLYGLIRRLGLANRPHAVAYAIRTGALA
ncbi:LuxR C-terminal-related transcriptional regulator [Amycolatopsis sp. NPDC049868]|uniref:helix-turn-helix transcriptional regulator n=1 Tax=Amycolatopsis sp. NPDC049868 TaxID=3363934 RepID=UPI0037B3088F